MAFKAIAGAIPQYQKSNGDLASGFFLAMESAGTSTTISMATDSDGLTLLVRAQLDSAGYPITGALARFIPFTDEIYKLSLYPTLADAIAKTNREWAIDNLLAIGDTNTTSNIFFAERFPTFALAVAAAAGKELVISTNIVVSSSITVSGLTLRFVQGGNLDPDTSITLTLNCAIDAGLYEIFDATAAGLIRGSFLGADIHPEWWNAIGDGTIAGGGTDDTAALNASYATAKAGGMRYILSAKDYRFTSQLDWDAEIDIVAPGRNQCNLIKDGAFIGILISDSDGAVYRGFTVQGATGNTLGGIDVFHGQRIHMSDIRIQAMGSAGDGVAHALLLRAGNNAGYDNFKITSNGGDGVRIVSGTGEPGQSLNACHFTALDLNGNNNNLHIVEGATNVIHAICQNAVAKNILIDTPSERNSAILYNEVENVPSTLAGNANDIVMMEGGIADNGTLNRVLEFNNAGLEMPFFRRMFAAQVFIQDRERVDGTNSSAWTATEKGDVTNSILDLIDGGSAAKPGIFNIEHNATPTQKVSINLDGSFTAGGNITAAGSIRNSVVETLASGATPNVAATNVFLISETTSKTNFLGGLTGKIIYLEATVTVAVVNNATIKLDGAVNYDMVAGDTLALMQFTTNLWREVGRMEVTP